MKKKIMGADTKCRGINQSHGLRIGLDQYDGHQLPG